MVVKRSSHDSDGEADGDGHRTGWGFCWFCCALFFTFHSKAELLLVQWWSTSWRNKITEPSALNL
jgi:hypothetical protein